MNKEQIDKTILVVQGLLIGLLIGVVGMHDYAANKYKDYISPFNAYVSAELSCTEGFLQTVEIVLGKREKISCTDIANKYSPKLAEENKK